MAHENVLELAGVLGTKVFTLLYDGPAVALVVGKVQSVYTGDGRPYCELSECEAVSIGNASLGPHFAPVMNVLATSVHQSADAAVSGAAEYLRRQIHQYEQQIKDLVAVAERIRAGEEVI